MGGTVFTKEHKVTTSMITLEQFDSLDPYEIDYRFIDRLEMELATGRKDIEELVSESAKRSQLVYTIFYKGRPIGICGVYFEDEQHAMPWCVGNETLGEIPLGFTKKFKQLLVEVHKDVPILYNYVLPSNEKHIKWLEFLGFKNMGHILIHGHWFVRYESRFSNNGIPEVGDMLGEQLADNGHESVPA